MRIFGPRPKRKPGKKVGINHTKLLSNGLTERQQDILDWISTFVSTRGFSPSIREIMEAFKIKSPNGIMCHIKSLYKKGFLAARGLQMHRCLVPTHTHQPRIDLRWPTIWDLHPKADVTWTPRVPLLSICE